MNWIKRLTSKAAKMPPPAPDIGFHAIGDIHGCLPQLTMLFDQLPTDLPVVCVGDYVDRGEDSAGVLRWLMAHPDIICIKGNHEAMMLDFIDNPREKGRRWISTGGLQSIASFDVRGLVTESAEDEVLAELSATFREALPDGLVDWNGIASQAFSTDRTVSDQPTAFVFAEELGLEIVGVTTVLPDFRYRAVDASGVVEHEVCPVHVTRVERGTEPTPDPAEVAEHAWLAWPDVRRIAATAPTNATEVPR